MDSADFYDDLTCTQMFFPAILRFNNIALQILKGFLLYSRLRNPQNDISQDVVDDTAAVL